MAGAGVLAGQSEETRAGLRERDDLIKSEREFIKENERMWAGAVQNLKQINEELAKLRSGAMAQRR